MTKKDEYMIAGLKLSTGKLFTAQDSEESKKYGSTFYCEASGSRNRQGEVSSEIYQQLGEGAELYETLFRGILFHRDADTKQRQRRHANCTTLLDANKGLSRRFRDRQGAYV